MESKILEKFCSSINYNTYKSVQNVAGLSSLASLASIFLFSQGRIISIPATYLFFMTYNDLFTGMNYTKDISYIKKLYKEFLTNYNNLNKTFNLNDPVEIYTMFNYLVYQGYLSKDKTFEFSSQQARDLNELDGVDVMTGKGVCRHISGMLVDIFNDSGIEAYALGVYCQNYNISLKRYEKPKYTKEELLNFARVYTATNMEKFKDILDDIEYLVDNNVNIGFKFEPKNEKSLFHEKIGNHEIAYVLSDNKSYFLDPTQARIYQLSQLDRTILYDDLGTCQIKTPATKAINTVANYHKLEDCLLSNYQNVPKEEAEQITRNILKMCSNNQDIFDKFYLDNKDIYNDVTDKLLKIKKPKRIIK